MAYTPAGNLTSTAGLTHYPTVYYSRVALDTVQKTFTFRDACKEDTLEKQVGKTIQWYRDTLSGILPGTISAKSEGAVGSSLVMATAPVSATLAQYADFLSASDLYEATTIDTAVESMSKNLGYRAAYIVDTLTRTEIDGLSSAELALLGSFYRAADAFNAAHLLQGLDVRPMQSGPASGFFFGVIHPYNSYDLVFDPDAGGTLDLYKYTQPDKVQNMALGMLPPIGGVKFVQSTNVKATSGTPNKWRIYVLGFEAVGVVSLSGKTPGRVNDPKRQRFNLNVISGGPDKADPEGVIGTQVSYNFTWVAKNLDTAPYRLRWTDAPSSIVA